MKKLIIISFFALVFAFVVIVMLHESSKMLAPEYTFTEEFNTGVYTTYTAKDGDEAIIYKGNEIGRLDSLTQSYAQTKFENGFYEGVIWAEQQYLVKLRTGNNDVFPVSSEMVNEELKRRREQ